MSVDENRDLVLDYFQQPQLQLNQQLLDGAASIVNRQKEEIIRSVNEMVSTKLQNFEAGIKESHQDLAVGELSALKFKKEGNEQQFQFNQKISLKQLLP